MPAEPDDRSETDILSGLCTDLVTETRLEPALVHLFGSKAVGEWVRVDELYRIAGGKTDGIKSDLVAAWLSSPDGDPGGAMVLFLDCESLWSTTAWYNVGRLRENRPEMSVAVTG